jgi:hypothetical protein
MFAGSAVREIIRAELGTGCGVSPFVMEKSPTTQCLPSPLLFSNLFRPSPTSFSYSKLRVKFLLTDAYCANN